MPPSVSYYAIKCPGPLYIQGKIRSLSGKGNKTLEQPLFSFHSTNCSQIAQALFKSFDGIVFDVHYIKNTVVSLCLQCSTSPWSQGNLFKYPLPSHIVSCSAPQNQPLMSSSHSPRQWIHNFWATGMVHINMWCVHNSWCFKEAHFFIHVAYQQ